MTETATITVPKIRDGDGQPTCRYFDFIERYLRRHGVIPASCIRTALEQLKDMLA